MIERYFNMSHTPQYKTKIIDLPNGITVGDELHKQVVIREQNVGDIIHTIKPDGNFLISQFEQVVRRVLRLGEIDNPGATLIETLKPEDYDAIIDAMQAMDGNAEDTDDVSKKNSI